MSPSYADINKLVEDNYFHWEYNMRMKLSRKGLLAHIVKPEFDALSDRGTTEWKIDDLKALGVIAGDVSLTYQVYIRSAQSAAEAWSLLEQQFNRNTLKNRLLVTKRLHNFKMEAGTRFAQHVDKFKELVMKMEAIGEPLDETRQIVLLLGSLTDEYRLICSVLENTPNVTLAHAIESLSGVEASEDTSPSQERAFASTKRGQIKRRFNGKCHYCQKIGHKEVDCRKKKADEGRGNRAQADASSLAFTAASTMARSEWLVDSGASSHMTSVREKFVTMQNLKEPIRIIIADGTKIDAVAIGTVGFTLKDGTAVTLSDVLYIPEVEGSLISVSKLAEKDVVAEFVKDKCVFRFDGAPVMEARRYGSIYKVETVGDEVCQVATARQTPWTVMHARLGHIPLKRYEELRAVADGLPAVSPDADGSDVCAGCCMGKMRADSYPRNPEKTVKTTQVLELVHSDVMGPMETKTPGGSSYVVTFVDDYSRHVTTYFMKKKSEVLDKFKLFKAMMENSTDAKIKRLRSDNGGEYTGKKMEAFLGEHGIKHEKTVPYTPQQNGMAERMNRSLVEMARCMLYHESIEKKWWAEALNTAAWIINRIPNAANTKTPFEIVHHSRPQLKNLKTFGAIGYAHVPDEKRRKLDPKAFKCRFMGYEDGVKGYRVLDESSEKIRIVRTVKFVETSSLSDTMNRMDIDDDDDVVCERRKALDEVPPVHDDSQVDAIVPYAPRHPMITRSRARSEEIGDQSEPARKKQVMSLSGTGTKRQKVDNTQAIDDTESTEFQFERLMVAAEIPVNFDDAVKSKDKAKWKDAMQSELASLTSNNTWELVPRPTHQRPIGCRWVYALKKDERGQVVRYKARLVAKGYSQRHGVDYDETYAPVANLNSIRTVLAVCCSRGMLIEQCDVDTAFLYGDLVEEIYMELPEGMSDLVGGAEIDASGGTLVCRLRKSLYGLKQASRVWNETINQHLQTLGFSPTAADPCVYTRGEGHEWCIICLYVDDMLIASCNPSIIAAIKRDIAKKFQIKDLGRARFILGIEIDYDESKQHLSIVQQAYTETVIARFGQANAKPSLTPIDTSLHLTKADGATADEDKKAMKNKPYRSLVGSLMYLAIGTRPDIAVAVAKLSRFLENPGPLHWAAGIKVVRYLLKTKDIGITYDGTKGTQLLAYSDADWAGDRDDRRSVSGTILLMCGAPVVWRASFQKTVALSSTEAEYMALSDCIKECVWMRLLLKGLDQEQSGPTVVYEDNQGTMALAKNVGYQARTKHIDIRYHFIREKLVSRAVELVYVESKNQAADFLTKALSSKTLRYLMDRCGIASVRRDDMQVSGGVAIALRSHHWTPIAPTLAARGLGELGFTRRVPV
jgi:transposase InsO family protein